MRGQRHGAAAAHGPADRPFGRHAQPGVAVGQRRQQSTEVLAAAADFNAQGPLPGGRQHLFGVENVADAGRHLQPLEASGRQHDAGVLALVELAQAGVEVAAQRLDLQV